MDPVTVLVVAGAVGVGVVVGGRHDQISNAIEKHLQQNALCDEALVVSRELSTDPKQMVQFELK